MVKGGLVEFGTHTGIDPGILVQLLESEPERYRLDRQQRLKIIAELEETENRFDFATRLVQRLGDGQPPGGGPGAA